MNCDHINVSELCPNRAGLSASILQDSEIALRVFAIVCELDEIPV